ncbi:MAG: helix-turn-helix domain-containing protein [Mycobacteriaceae bacterium]
MADATAAVAFPTRRSHPNAPLTPHGRRRLSERVDAGRPISHVAAEAGVSRQCLGTWHARWTELGEAGLQDRSGRPARSPNSTPDDIVEKIVTLRRTRKWGPARIAAELLTASIRIAASTVHRVLRRLGLGRLRDLDPPTGEQLRHVKQASCYQRERPGTLIHLDVKKLGRFPDGGGWRVHGKGSAQDRAARRKRVGPVRPGQLRLANAGSATRATTRAPDLVGFITIPSHTRTHIPHTCPLRGDDNDLNCLLCPESDALCVRRVLKCAHCVRRGRCRFRRRRHPRQQHPCSERV